MIRRDDDDRDSDVQMTPMIDMVFLLLIFFLVTASLKKPHKELPIELPQATAARDARYQDELVITVTAEGERYLDDGRQHRNQAPVSREDMITVLAQTAQENQQREVQGEVPIAIRLDIDRRVRYYHLMDIADTLELHGLREVQLRSAHGVHDEVH